MVWFAFLAVVAALRATTVYALTRAVVVAAVVVATHVALVPTVPTVVAVEDEKTFLQFFFANATTISPYLSSLSRSSLSSAPSAVG